MDIHTRKIQFIREFLKIQNEELIARLEKLLRSGKPVKENDYNPMTVDELNARIDKSMNDSENDRLTTSADLVIEIENWN